MQWHDRELIEKHSKSPRKLGELRLLVGIVLLIDYVSSRHPPVYRR